MIRWRKAESRAKEARKRALDPHMGEVYKRLRKSTRFISIEEVAGVYVVALFDKYKNSISAMPLTNPGSVMELLDNLSVDYQYESEHFILEVDEDGLAKV